MSTPKNHQFSEHKRRYLLLKLIPLIILICASLSSCYVLKQGTYFLYYQAKAKSNEQLLESSKTSEQIKSFLRLVDEISEFSVSELGLEKNRNYKKLVEIDREFLVYVVSAAEKTSFTNYTWRFPIVGDVPYKGYYTDKDAERVAEQLKEDGYDVLIRKVGAFSSLGFFRDPLFSFMESYSEYEIANLIIHEQTHATVFVKNQTQFNEELATFVGEKGSELFIKQKYGTESDIYKRMVDEEKDLKQYLQSMRALRTRLENLYESGKSAEIIIEEKAQIIDEFKEDFAVTYDEHFLTDRFRYLPEMNINNALLNLYALYTADLDLYQALYEKLGSDLRAFVEYMREIAEQGEDPKAAIRRAL